MPRLISFNARQAAGAEQTGEIDVVLTEITHPDLEDPLRLSTDPTELLSEEPLVYGTKSGGYDWLFCGMGAILPGDEEGAPQSVSLFFENIDGNVGAVARSILTPARIDLFRVLASSPDVIEQSYIKFQGTEATIEADKVEIAISRAHFTSEPFPPHPMSKQNTPGLFV